MPRLSASEVVKAQAAHRHHAAVRAMHRVAYADEQITASLQRLGRELRQAANQSKNPQTFAGSEGSTAPQSGRSDGRAASAQSDTRY